MSIDILVICLPALADDMLNRQAPEPGLDPASSRARTAYLRPRSQAGSSASPPRAPRPWTPD